MRPDSDGGGVTTWDIRRPAMLTVPNLVTWLLPLLGMGLLIGAEYRLSGLEGSQDPVSLLLHLLGLVLIARGYYRLPSLVRAVSRWTQSRSVALEMGDDTLTLSTPGEKVSLARRELWGAVEGGDWRSRPGGRRTTDVYLVRAGSPRWYLSIPPVFEATPGIVAEELMRWRGPQPIHLAPAPPTDPLASEIFETAQSGAPRPGDIAIAQSKSWLAGGPYISLFFGAAVLLQLRHASERMIADLSEGGLAVLTASLAVLLVSIPAAWLLQSLRHIRPRGGLALLLTPHRALLRTKAGVQDIAWSKVNRIGVDESPSWSVLQGRHTRRSLVIGHANLGNVRIDESQLAAPLEAIALAAECLRTGQTGAVASSEP